MRKLWYILKKELLLLFRDIPGLIILFLMPVLLIFVVTLAQEKALQGQGSRTPVLFVDRANTAFSLRLALNLDSSGFFQPVKQVENIPVSAGQARMFIGHGDYKFGVIIPGGDSAIVLLLDPTLQETYKMSVTNSLTYIIKGTQAKEAMNGILG